MSTKLVIDCTTGKQIIIPLTDVEENEKLIREQETREQNNKDAERELKRKNILQKYNGRSIASLTYVELLEFLSIILTGKCMDDDGIIIG